MEKYRAIRGNYGFRGTFWEIGSVAEDVTKAEAERIDVKTHFHLIKAGETDEFPGDRSHEPREIETLADLTERTVPREKSRKK